MDESSHQLKTPISYYGGKQVMAKDADGKPSSLKNRWPLLIKTRENEKWSV